MLLKDVIFDAVDGEAFDDGGHHNYFLLVASCFDTGWKQAWNSLQVGKDKLPTWCIFRALQDLGRSKNRIHVAFSFTYDVTKWIEDWPVEMREELFHGGHVLWNDKHGTVYDVTFLPHKLFRIKFKDYLGVDRTVQIYDVFGFFQKSFIKALKDWGLTEEIEFVERMKKERGTFKREASDEVMRYSLMETDLLCQLMNRVRDALVSQDINMEKFFGAGSIAEAILRKYNMQDDIFIPDWYDNEGFMLACLGAYFGGRFELFKQGVFNESHQYDINSAYPSAMAGLPSFANSTISAVSTYDSESDYSLWFVTYKIPKNKQKRIGPLPFRTSQGSILFPFKNEYGVWVHQVELRQAIRFYGPECFKIHNGYIVVPLDGRSVYSFIPVLAKERLLLKERGDERNIVLKLGLNSLYGKTAQSVTGHNRLPPFQNFYIAGLITATTRAKLLHFSMAFPNAVIQFATDGVFADSPHPVLGQRSTTALGKWEYKHLEKKTIYLKPGIYWVEREEGEKARRKTRGFKTATFTVGDIFGEWDKEGPYGILDGVERRFVGIGTCIVNNDWSKYGTWQPIKLQLRFGPGPTKWYTYGGQNAIGQGEDGNDNAADYYLLEPYQRKVTAESEIYVPHFVDKVDSLDYYDAETQSNIRIEMHYADQPDYTKYVGFGDAESQE